MNKSLLSLICVFFLDKSLCPIVSATVYSLGNEIYKVQTEIHPEANPQKVLEIVYSMQESIVKKVHAYYRTPDPEFILTPNQDLSETEQYFARYLQDKEYSYSIFNLRRYFTRTKKYVPSGSSVISISEGGLREYMIGQLTYACTTNEDLNMNINCVVILAKYNTARTILRSDNRFLGLCTFSQEYFIDFFPLDLDKETARSLADLFIQNTTKQENIKIMLAYLAEHAPRSDKQIEQFLRLNQ